jgi:hypothetical protein
VSCILIDSRIDVHVYGRAVLDGACWCGAEGTPACLMLGPLDASATAGPAFVLPPSGGDGAPEAPALDRCGALHLWTVQRGVCV